MDRAKEMKKELYPQNFNESSIPLRAGKQV